jgi:hypothetical protein
VGSIVIAPAIEDNLFSAKRGATTMKQVLIKPQKCRRRMTIPVRVCRKMRLGNRELVNLYLTTEHGETVVAWSEVTTSGCEVIVKSPAARVLMAPRNPLLLHVERA